MVYRFEMTPPSSQRGILQYMVPWLCNVELLDDSPHPQIISQSDCTEETTTLQPTNPVLSGSGWGSTNGTRVVLHNLLYITAKVGGVMCIAQCQHSSTHVHVLVSTIAFFVSHLSSLFPPLHPPVPPLPLHFFSCSMETTISRKWRVCGVLCVHGLRTFVPH